MKQKQFNRTTQLALLGGALLGAGLFAPPAQAKPFPKKGYILEDRSVANIGRRSSLDNGNRGAMRMLARLIRRDPNAGLYHVKWKFPLANGKTQSDGILFVVPERWLETNETRYANVKKWTIFAVAKRSGTSLDLPFYNAIDFDHPVKINLGKQPSKDAGSRVAIQVIANSLDNARSAQYDIRWNSTLSNGQSRDFLVTYTPVEVADGSIDVASSPLQTKVKESKRENMSIEASYSSFDRKGVLNVAKRHGKIDDLVLFGGEKIIRGDKNDY